LLYVNKIILYDLSVHLLTIKVIFDSMTTYAG